MVAPVYRGIKPLLAPAWDWTLDPLPPSTQAGILAAVPLSLSLLPLNLGIHYDIWNVPCLIHLADIVFFCRKVCLCHVDPKHNQGAVVCLSHKRCSHCAVTHSLGPVNVFYFRVSRPRACLAKQSLYSTPPYRASITTSECDIEQHYHVNICL